MEERKITRPTAPDIDASTLFGLYMLLPENQDKDISLNDFIDFITVESVERELFLNEYCDYELIEIGNSIALRYKVKE